MKSTRRLHERARSRGLRISRCRSREALFLVVPYGRPGGYVSKGCQPFSGDCISRGSHIAHSRGVDPFIVEIEERAHGNGIVQCLIAPARGLHPVYVFLLNPAGFTIHLLDECKQRLLPIADRSSSIIFQHRVDQGAIAQQGRRDRGVGTDSEQTVITPGGKCRDQFAETGGQRRRPAHHALGEP